MPDRRLRIIVAAENIPGVGSGLGYFLLKGVRQLVESQKAWQFKIVASSSFHELKNIDLPNMQVIFWDNTLIQQATAKLIDRYFPMGNYLLGRFIPTQWLKVKFGNLRALYRSLGDADVIWLPHYAVVGGKRFSSLNSLNSVRSPILFTIHDIHAAFFPDDWSADSLNSFWKGFVPFAQNSQCIITHSQFQREAIIEHLKIEPDKVVVTPCPPLIDGSRLLEKHSIDEKTSVLSKFGISSPFALYPGSGGHTHKNHIRLLLAWAELKHKLGSKCPMLVCTAKGHLWPSLKSLIDALALQDIVTFTDIVDTATLSILYQNCTFVIVPSLYEGGGSGPVAEALMAGKPVVCSNIPPIKEQLHSYSVDMNTGFVTLFSPDSIDSIVETTESVLQTLSDIGHHATKVQEQLLALSSKLWEEWGEFYAKHIRNIADKQVNGY